MNTQTKPQVVTNTNKIKEAVLTLLKDNPHNSYTKSQMQEALFPLFITKFGAPLRQLEQEGLITSRKYRGKKIYRYNVTDALLKFIEQNPGCRVKELVDHLCPNSKDFKNKKKTKCYSWVNSKLTHLLRLEKVTVIKKSDPHNKRAKNGKIGVWFLKDQQTHNMSGNMFNIEIDPKLKEAAKIWGLDATEMYNGWFGNRMESLQQVVQKEFHVYLRDQVTQLMRNQIMNS